MRLHPEHAPRHAFRGQRRYFRRVHRKAAEFALAIGPTSWWDSWHYHADWPGWGNRRGRWRREHVRALCRVFQTIVAAHDRFVTPFQAWICLAHDDAGQDATFLHTPNANATPFPVTISNLRSTSSPFEADLRAFLPELVLDVATTGVDTWDGDDRPMGSTYAWARGVGVPLVP